jgi:hypothetical protein
MESQNEKARRELSDFFKSTANLQLKRYAIFGSKKETGSLSNLLDVELGGLMKLFESLQFVRFNVKKRVWSVKTNILEQGLSSMIAKYNVFNNVKYIELGSLKGSGSRDDTTIELARTAIKETIETMFPPDSAAPVSNDTSTADSNPEQTPSTEQTQTPSTEQPTEQTQTRSTEQPLSTPPLSALPGHSEAQDVLGRARA